MLMRGFRGKFGYWCAIVAVILAVAVVALAQTPPRKQPAKPPAPAAPPSDSGQTYERSIAVDSNVDLTLCVSRGDLKINGWNRNEVRVFVEDGSKFDFAVRQKNERSGLPVWIMVKYGPASECIWADSVIEIDAPVNATLSLKTGETTTVIDGLKRIEVKSNGGDISIRNISGGVNASTWQGDVSVEASRGTISLDTTTGNIVAFDVGPGEPGDTFHAKTNGGAVSLQKITHRQIDVSSISGTLAYTGELRSGGSYTFSTTRGAIRLSLPQETSCIVTALYGFGKFNSELPIKTITQDIQSGPVMRVNGQLGNGGCTLALTTNSGEIGIKKL